MSGNAKPSGGYEGERLAKRLARAGLCSRREAERWIEAGRVAVNGSIVNSPALNVTDKDRIEVDGKPVGEPEPPRLWRFYKKAGLVTTNRDPQGRPTVFDALPEDLPRVVSVGRLDYNTEGLLLLTNDGELARYLELPATGLARRYRVRVHGIVKEEQLAALAGGLTVDGVAYGPVTAVLDRQKGGNAWLTMTLREGKNREIRKLCTHLGWDVNRLIRVSYGPFMLGQLEPGDVKEVPRRVLADQFGHRFQFGDEETKPPRGPSAGGTKGRQKPGGGTGKGAAGKPERGRNADRRRRA